jgi:hypothetical protein
MMVLFSSKFSRSRSNIVRNGIESLGKVILKSLQDLRFSVTLSSFGEVGGGLLKAPSLLGSKGSFVLSQFGLVELKGLSESGKEVGGGLDQGVKAVNFVSKGLFLLGQVGKQDFPVSLGALLSLSGNGLLLDNSGSNVLQEF